MANKRLGLPVVVEQPRKLSGGPNKPVVITRSWKGPKTAIAEKLSSVAGYDWTMDEGPGPNATLTAVSTSLDANGGELPVDTWELIPSQLEKDLLSADVPGMNDVPNDLTLEKIVKIKQEVELSLATGTETTALTGFSLLMYDHLIRNATSVLQWAPVLRHTRTVSSVWTIQAANTYAKRILSNSLLISFEAPPSGFLINLGSSPFTDVPTAGAPSWLKYGWLKAPPTLQATYGSRFQISQEWSFGLWSEVMYGRIVS